MRRRVSGPSRRAGFLRAACALMASLSLLACGAGRSPHGELAAANAEKPPPRWTSLARDGIHDPQDDALPYLQEPAEALSLLPQADVGGNNVNWVKALQSGAITPRAKIAEQTKVRVLDLDVVMPNTAGMPAVVFPHRAHTEWLDCSNCHDKIFKEKAGATKFGMFDILQGNYCGQCHGAVAFPLTECLRCHSKDQK